MNANDLPLPLLVGSIVVCTLAMILLTLNTHGKVKRGWGEAAVCGSLVLLLVAFGVGVSR
jgi:hypothetical protein